MKDQLIAVPFYDENLVLVNHNDEPYVAMKPIVTNLGLDWKSQHTKLSEKFDSAMVQTTTTGADGKQYEMICLHLRKIPAYLYSISPNKVKPELKDKIIRYQDKCDDVLWQYWTKGAAINPRKRALSVSQIISAQKHINSIIRLMKYEHHTPTWQMLYEQLKQSCQLIDIKAPDLEAFWPLPMKKTEAEPAEPVMTFRSSAAA